MFVQKKKKNVVPIYPVDVCWIFRRISESFGAAAVVGSENRLIKTSNLKLTLTGTVQ